MRSAHAFCSLPANMELSRIRTKRKSVQKPSSLSSWGLQIFACYVIRNLVPQTCVFYDEKSGRLDDKNCAVHQKRRNCVKVELYIKTLPMELSQTWSRKPKNSSCTELPQQCSENFHLWSDCCLDNSMRLSAGTVSSRKIVPCRSIVCSRYWATNEIFEFVNLQ